MRYIPIIGSVHRDNDYSHQSRILMIQGAKTVQLALWLTVCVCIFWASGVSALSQRDLYSLGIYYFDIDGTGACDTGTAIDASKGSDTPKWHTTLQAPFSLEDFVVEVLRDVAAKEGVPESDTVTQEHVLALMAFAYGEGGNLTNNDIYNPWNTGYSGDDLKPAGGHSTSGVQSYSSFDDGVEATSRVMTGTGGSGGYQSRLGTALKDPNTDALSIMKTLTYYQKYQDNKPWAEASMPPNQDTYYQGRLQLIQTVKSNYKNIASLVIGPPGNSANNNQYSPHPLRYSFTEDIGNTGGTTTTSSSTCASAGGVVQGSIVDTAVGLAWSDVIFPTKGAKDTESCQSADPSQNPSSCHHGFQQQGVDSPKIYTRQSYQDAVAKYNSGVDSTDYTDCGVFVATVMHASGIDKNYPGSGTSTQLNYAQQHPDKYLVIPNADPSQLQPGDIMVNADHTYIYIGKQANTQYTVAEASQFNHAPEIDNVPYGGFYLVRVK
jgi:hypothetical protein